MGRYVWHLKYAYVENKATFQTRKYIALVSERAIFTLNWFELYMILIFSSLFRLHLEMFHSAYRLLFHS